MSGSEIVIIRLSKNDIGQIIDGLSKRMEDWRATAEYLKSQTIRYGILVEECSDSDEAEAIAGHYENIICNIKKQCKYL